MGTDIHIFFEKKIDDKWTCYPFVPTLVKDEWWESLLYSTNSRDKELEKALLAFGALDKEELKEKMTNYYENLSLDEAEIIYYTNPYCWREWDMPYELRSRNYDFFNQLSGLRGNNRNPIVSGQISLPNDTCYEIFREYTYWKGDAHTLGWIMLDRLFLEAPNTFNVQKIKEYMESINEYDYENIRMVFWYDN